MNDSAFYKLTSRYPYDHQHEIAAWLEQRRNVLLRAPTGSGKTLAVLAPFLLNRKQIGAHRLIYTLPMRTLAQGIYAEAQKLAEKVGYSATIQTGEQPEDPFFDKGDIVITTYDQLLSGYLCGPYGQSSRLYNINAAAVAGCLIVFDEFHLMEPDKAFLTGIECIKSFKDWCLSVWMTATGSTYELRSIPRCEGD